MSDDSQVKNNLEVLAKNRDALLLAEVAAWLHDWKKCTDEHVVENSRGEKPDILIKPDDLLSLIPQWQLTFLGDSIEVQKLIRKEEDDSLEEERKANHWLVRALIACHSAAHTEKELVLFLFQQSASNAYKGTPFGFESEKLANLNSLLNQLSKFMQSVGNDIEQAIDDIEQKIKETFSYASGDTRQPINDVSLWDWSRMVAALYKAVLAEAVLKGEQNPHPTKWQLFSVRLDSQEFLGKTSRLPDLLARQKLIDDGLDRIRFLLERKYPLGTEIYRDENGSVFIVPNLDILKLKNESGGNLSGLIQQKFSQGTIKDDPFLRLRSEILPFDKVDEGSWEWTNPYIAVQTPQQIMDWHNKPMPIVAHVGREGSRLADPSAVDSWWQHHREDICTVCQLRPQGWGAADNDAHYLHKVRKELCPSKPTCQTCKAIERKVCAICEQRRVDRAKEWFSKLHQTIWIDEVTDINGRVALIIGDFDLKQWFSGKFLFYPQKHWDEKKPTIEDSSQPIQGALRVKNLGNQLANSTKFLSQIFALQERTGLLVTGFLDKPSKFKMPARFRSRDLHVNDLNLDLIVEDITLSPTGHYQIMLESLPSELMPGRTYLIQGRDFRVSDDSSYIETTNEGAKQVVEGKILYPQKLKVERSYILPMLEQAPAQMVEAQAPTRLYRVWETTQAFWESAVSDFENPAHAGKVPGRLQIEGTFTNGDSLGESHTYELKLGNTSLSIVCKDPQTYLTVDNLRWVAKLLGMPEDEYKGATDEVKYQEAAKYLKKHLENGQFDIEEPTGYGSSNKLRGKLRITKVEIDDTQYTPAIPILTEPRTFMALVPADKAIRVVDSIKKKYEKEMGKVRNRLPLTVGVVFAGRRTPLPAILDAGRRMLRQQVEVTGNDSEKATEQPDKKVKGWQVKDIDLSSYPEKAVLKLRPEEDEVPTLTLDIPTIMGDGITEDVWYPYWCLEKERDNPSPRARMFKGADGKDWVHISDLQEGDTVSFMPSHLDFEFLDTASRRFEVSYEDGKRRGHVHPARPYYLEQLDDIEELWTMLKEGLATSQIDNLVGLIGAKCKEWLTDQDNPVFRQIVSDIVANASWKARLDEEERKRLIQAAVSGQLADVVELHMTILKEGGNDGNNT